MNLKLILILLLALILRTINLNQSLWLDEAAQISESARPFAMLFDQSIVPHPPLYRILMHYWMLGGKSEIYLRIPSVLFGIGTIIVIYFLSIKLGAQWDLNDKKQRLLAFYSSLLLAVNQFHIYYSQEFRPYSLVCLLGLISTYFMISQKWIFYLLSSIALIYSAYFGFFLIFGHLIYVLIFKRNLLKNIIYAILITCLSFVFYIPSFLKQFSTLGIGMVRDVPGWGQSVSVPVYKVLPLTFFKFLYGRISFENKYIYGLVFVLFVLIYLFLVGNIYKKNKTVFFKIISLIFFPVIFSLMISIVVPVIAPQRLIFVLPFLLISVCLGLIFQTKIIRHVILILLLILNISAVLLYIKYPQYQREQWREAVSFVEKDGNNNSIALFVFPQPFGPWSYYEKNRIKTYAIAKKLVVTDEDLTYLAAKLSDRKKIYLFQYLTGLTDREGKTRKLISNLGFVENSIRDFPGVGFIYIYDRK